MTTASTKTAAWLPPLRRCRAGRVLRFLVLAAMTVLAGYPLLWMLFSALREEGAVLAAPFALPLSPTLKNFAAVLRTGAFGRAYLNSLLITGGSVALAAAVAAMAAFAFSRLRLRGATLLFFIFLAGMMVPIHVTLIPLNRLLGPDGFGFKGTVWVLLGPYVGFALPVSILILRNAFDQVPDDLLDMARLDGCSDWGIFLHVALPLIRPALATVVIFNALTIWNEFAFALTLITEQADWTVPLALWRFKGEHGMFVARTCAALAVTVVPLLVLYVLAQRHIIRGLTAGAVKE